MKIIWAILATKALKEIHLYHKIVAGERIAIKIKSGIFAATKQLTNQSIGAVCQFTVARVRVGCIRKQA